MRKELKENSISRNFLQVNCSRYIQKHPTDKIYAQNVCTFTLDNTCTIMMQKRILI